MAASIFQGELVCLVSEDPEKFAKDFSRWGRDSEFIRLLDNDPARLVSVRTAKKWFEKDLDKDSPDEAFFIVHTLETDQSIGFVGLGGIGWNHGEAWVGIGIGERDCWGKGYGTDAMRIILRYAFTELNLHRVSLGVFEYNPRAIRSYEKAGFVHEGRNRKLVSREGKRWDEVHMGVLRGEWLEREKEGIT
jgi:RimJ/RimL family protein N-acetyltransferase